MRASLKVLFSALLATVAAPSLAAPVVYEIEGYFTSRSRANEQLLHPSFSEGFPFTGSITIDMERTEYDVSEDATRPDVIVAVELRTTRATLKLTSNPAFSGSVIVERDPTFERFAAGATLLGPEMGTASSVTLSLSWRATNEGQLPEDLHLIDLAALDPSAFRLSMRADNADCYQAPSCDPRGRDYIGGQVTSLKERGSSPSQYSEAFATPPVGWSGSTADWTTTSGYYANSQNSAFSGSIYAGQSLADSFVVSSRLYSSWKAAGNALGLVFNYIDPANFYEVRVNALGTATLNKVADGTRTMLRTTQFLPAHRTWFDVVVARDDDRIHVEVAGQALMTIDDSQHRGGRAGVFASWNLARFDDFHLTQRSGNLQKTDTSSFDTYTDQWTAVSGTWSQTGAYFRSSSNVNAAIALSKSTIPSDHYAIDARMFLEWSSSGNRGGFVYDYQDDRNYRAIMLSPAPANDPLRTSRLSVVEVRNGGRTTVAAVSNAFTFATREWCAMSLERLGELTRVSICGNSSFAVKQAIVPGTKHVGLMTSWNLGGFDDVVIGVFDE